MQKDIPDEKKTQETTQQPKLHFWDRLPLRSQLIVVVATIVMAVVAGVTVISIQRESRILREDLEQSALSLTRAMEAAMQDFLYFLDVDTISNLGSSFADYPNVLEITIYDANGRVLYSSVDSSLVSRLNADSFGIQLVNSDQTYSNYENGGLVTGQRYIIGRQVLGAASVKLSTEDLSAAVEASIYRGILSGLAASAIAILVIVFMSQTISRPITQLANTTYHIAQGDFSKHLVVQGGSQEIRELADAIDDMREDLRLIYQELEDRIAERTLDLKKARDEAVTAQRIAQENSRLKSEFLSTMSHELRTPLNAIEGFTSIMLGGMGIELSPRAEDMVRRVSSNSKRLLHLINDFLDLSRIEAGRLELNLEPLSPGDLARTWVNSVGVLAKEKDLDFNVDVSKDLPDMIIGDEDALSKIAINLLGNAFKFTHEGHISLNIQRDENNWMIIVSDTGIGIPPYAREYIFDEFRQVDGSSKRLYGGTGLGLSLVQKLARAMDGTVTLQSELDEGSTFTVKLPLKEYTHPQDIQLG